MEERTGLGNHLPGYGLPHSRLSGNRVSDLERFIQLGSSGESPKPNRNSWRGDYGNRSVPRTESGQRFSTEYYIGIGLAYLGLFLIILLIILG